MKLRFKAKKYGWGRQPAARQGRMVIIIRAILVITNFYRIDAVSHSTSDVLISFIPETIVLTVILIRICYKTGEKPRRRRGKK